MRLLLLAGLLCLASSVAAAGQPAAPSVEGRLSEVVASSRVTVVHLWAPWCPNCKAELEDGGWTRFIAANPDAAVVFVTIWSSEDGGALLERYGIGKEANFTLFLHPNPSRRKGEQLSSLLGLPVSWIPTTWIFRDGKLRYALNYGEMRFPILQQLVRDASDSWDR